MSDRPNSDQPKLSPILGLPVDDEPSRPAPPAAAETTLTPLGEEIRFELSVIIPARNEERNLPACLESLLVQDSSLFPLGTDWELIVVDDHSTDRTRAIAQEAAAKHCRRSCVGGSVTGRYAGRLHGQDERVLVWRAARARAMAAVYRRGYDA